MALEGNNHVEIVISANGTQAIVTLRRTADETTRAGSRARAASTDFDRLSGSLKSLAAGYVSLQGFKEIALAFIQANIQAQQLKMAFTAVTGSAQLAQRELEYVRGVVEFLGLDIQTTSKQFLDLTAASKGTVLEGQATKDIFEAVATAMARLGKTSDETSGAFLAIQQMISKGKVQAEELRGQLGERLPGAFALASKAMGVTGGELNKLLETGKVLAEDLLPRLAIELNKIYDTDKKISGVVAEWNRLKTAIKALAVNADETTGSMSLLETVISDFTWAINNINNASQGLGLREIKSKFEELSALVELSAELQKKYSKLSASLAKTVAAGFYDSSNISGSLLETAQKLGEVEARIAETKQALVDKIASDAAQEVSKYNALIQKRETLIKTFNEQTENLQTIANAGFDTSEVEMYQKLVLKTAQDWGEVESQIAKVEKESSDIVQQAAEIRRANELIAKSKTIADVKKQLNDITNQYDPLAKAVGDFAKAQLIVNQAVSLGITTQEEAVELLKLSYAETIGAVEAAKKRAAAQSAAAKADKEAAKYLESLTEAYIPGLREARAYTKAQESLTVAVKNGSISQSDAQIILRALQVEMVEALKNHDDLTKQVLELRNAFIEVESQLKNNIEGYENLRSKAVAVAAELAKQSASFTINFDIQDLELMQLDDVDVSSFTNSIIAWFKKISSAAQTTSVDIKAVAGDLLNYINQVLGSDLSKYADKIFSGDWLGGTTNDLANQFLSVTSSLKTVADTSTSTGVQVAEDWETTARRIANSWATPKASAEYFYKKLISVGKDVQEASKLFGIPEEVIISVIRAESTFNNLAKSHKGASGAMQIIRATAGDLSRDLKKLGIASYSVDQIMTEQHPNIIAGTLYLKQLSDKYGTLEKALWAYNAGMKRVNENYMPDETKVYIKKITGYLSKIKTVGNETTGTLTDIKTKATSTQASVDGLYDSASNVVTVFYDGANAVDEFIERMSVTPYERLTQDIANYKAQNEALIPLYAQKLYWEDQVRQGVKLSSTQLEQSKTATENLNTAVQAQISYKQQIRAEEERQIKSGALVNYQLELTEEELEQIGSQYKSSKSATENYRLEVARINAAQRSHNLTLKETKKALQDAKDEYESSKGPMSEYLVELKKGIGGLEEFGVAVMDSLVDTITDGLEDGKLSFKSFVDDVQSYLAKIAAKKIVLTFASALNLTTVTSAAAGATSGATSATDTISGLSSLGSIGKVGSLLTGNGIGSTVAKWFGYDATVPVSETFGLSNIAGTSNWLIGGSSIVGSLLGSSLFDGKGYSSVGSSVGSTAGSIIGSMLNIGIPGVGTILGSLLGGTAGGWLGSLFGDDEPKFGGYATSFSGSSAFEDEIGAAGSFGLHFGIRDKGTKNVEASEYAETLEGLSTVSDTLANFYGDELEGLVKTSLQNQLGDHFAWGKTLDESFKGIFGTIINTATLAEEDSDGMAHAFSAALDEMGGIESLGTSAAAMTNAISNGIEFATYGAKLFNTEIGKILGMGIGEEFGSVAESTRLIVNIVPAFREDSETIAETITKITENVQVFDAAVTLTGTSIDALNVSTWTLLYRSEDLRESIEDLGLTMADFSSLQTTYYEAAYTEAERAAKQAEAARKSIKSWNDEMGFVGDAYIESLADLRAYIESLDPLSDTFDELFASAIKASTAFISLDSALQSLGDSAENLVDALMEAITPESITNAAVIEDLVQLFHSWGMQIPKDADSLYALIQAGALTEEQIEELAKRLGDLETSWSALADMQAEALDALQDAYDAAVSAAQDASDQRIDDLEAESDAKIAKWREESDAYLEKLQADYDALSEKLETELTAAEDALSTFSDIVESAGDALRALTEQTDGIDETRQRSLAEARAAILQYKTTGVFPDDITDIIGRLDTVNAEDFADRSDWLRAIAENKAVLSEIEEIGVDRVSEAEQQITLLEQQITQAAEQYEAAQEAEEDRLNDLIEAEEENLTKLINEEKNRLADELDFLKDEFDRMKEAIETLDVEALVDMSKSEDLLDGIDFTLREILARLADTVDPSERKFDQDLTVEQKKLGGEIVTNMAQEYKAPLWDQIKNIVSNDGLKNLEIPDYNYGNDYNMLDYLLNLWQSQGLMVGEDKLEIANLLAKWGVKVKGFSQDDIYQESADTLNNMTQEQRAPIWRKIQDLVSNNGQIELPTQNIDYGTAYQKVSNLLSVWSAMGLVEDSDRAEIKSLLAKYDVVIPGFAAGGEHLGGLRIVGEDGPELEYTGPAHITPNNNIGDVMRDSNVDLLEELKELRNEVSALRSLQSVQTNDTNSIYKLHRKWDTNGLPPDRDNYLKMTANATYELAFEEAQMYIIAPIEINPETDVLQNTALLDDNYAAWEADGNYLIGAYVTTGTDPNIKIWRLHINVVHPYNSGSGLPILSCFGIDPAQYNRVGYDNAGSKIADPRDYPNIGDLWWEDVTNNVYLNNGNRMFDADPSTYTEMAYGIDLKIRPSSAWNSITLLGCSFEHVYIQIVNGPTTPPYGDYPGVTHYITYTNPLSPEYLNEPHVSYLLLNDGAVVDPAEYPDAYLLVMIRAIDMHSGTLCKVGSLIVGRAIQIGRAIYGLDIELVDYSRYERDVFGYATVIRRGYSDRVTFPHVIEPAELTQARSILAARRALPTVFVGSFDVPATIIYGYFQDLEQTYDSFAKVSGSVVVESILFDAPVTEIDPASGLVVFVTPQGTACVEMDDTKATLCIYAGQIRDQVTATFLVPQLAEGDSVEWNMEWTSGSSTIEPEITTLETDCNQSLSLLSWPPESVLPVNHAEGVATITATITFANESTKVLTGATLSVIKCAASAINWIKPDETVCISDTLGSTKELCIVDGAVQERVAATFLTPELADGDSVAWTMTWVEGSSTAAHEVTNLETECGQTLSVFRWPAAAVALPLEQEPAVAEVKATITFANGKKLVLTKAVLNIDFCSAKIEFFDPEETECVEEMLGPSQVLCRVNGEVTEQVAATFLSPSLGEGDSVDWTLTWIEGSSTTEPEISTLETTCEQTLSVLRWPPANALPLTQDEGRAKVSAVITFADDTTLALDDAYFHVACTCEPIPECISAPTAPTWSTGGATATAYVRTV